MTRKLEKQPLVPRAKCQIEGVACTIEREDNGAEEGEDEEFPRTMRRRHAWPLGEVEGSICKLLDP